MKNIVLGLILLVSFVFCSGFMGSCGMGVGMLMDGASGETSGQTPLNKLNHSNLANRQECLDRGGHWESIPKLVQDGKTYYGKGCVQ
jgi:hypothetical protein